MMMTKMSKILKDVDNQFVDEYSTILIYKKNTLIKNGR